MVATGSVPHPSTVASHSRPMPWLLLKAISWHFLTMMMSSLPMRWLRWRRRSGQSERGLDLLRRRQNRCARHKACALLQAGLERIASVSKYICHLTVYRRSLLQRQGAQGELRRNSEFRSRAAGFCRHLSREDRPHTTCALPLAYGGTSTARSAAAKPRPLAGRGGRWDYLEATGQSGGVRNAFVPTFHDGTFYREEEHKGPTVRYRDRADTRQCCVSETMYHEHQGPHQL